MDPLRLRIARVVSRVVRWAAVEVAGADDTPYPVQRVGFLGKSTDSNTWYPYGFNALAPAGALSLMFAVGGDANSQVHLPGSPQERIKVAPGEVVVYNPTTKAKIHFRANGDIDIDSPGMINISAETEIEQVAPVMRSTGTTVLGGTAFLTGSLRHTGGTVGFYGATAIAKPTVTGDRSTHVAIANLLTALETMGLIVDTTSA